MHINQFNEREIAKIKSLHKVYGLDVKIIATRFACSTSKIKKVLAAGRGELGDDVRYLQKRAPQQFKALVFINRRIENYDKFPTDQQLKDHLGYRSMNSAREIKDKLFARGWLDKNPDTFAWQLAKTLPKHAEMIA